MFWFIGTIKVSRMCFEGPEYWLKAGRQEKMPVVPALLITVGRLPCGRAYPRVVVHNVFSIISGAAILLEGRNRLLEQG